MDTFIDQFDKNIRINFGLPGYNNGTKKYMQMLNTHAYDNLMSKKDLADAYRNYSVDNDYISQFTIEFNEEDYPGGVIRVQQWKTHVYNDYLKKIKCPHKMSKHPRVGMHAILSTLMSGEKNIHVINFSLNVEDNKHHLYNRLDNHSQSSKTHDVSSEQRILKWLHENKYVDAHFCL